ncbi:MAG TPA: efflux RND transporter periplasmic adaptor subunit [Chitinophaga sp.]|uniref:efflux RND transporter periplasmic adaptor subunit n=1 Tax=Chitinophaga sp. TaxID=1869181 RepID=UPI002D1DB065|nr:efflux RND transporter periplasmic adaptor subunit [Chitinophaga sp.]HVI46082.1 efflux RND transporter periplasmic adaptor subunit [Chitinophaga sp.]
MFNFQYYMTVEKYQLYRLNPMRILAGGLVISFITGLYGCAGHAAVNNAPPSLPVVTVSALPAVTYQDFTASIEGSRDIEIRPLADGYLTDIAVDEGAYVQKGQVLFRIDKRPYEEQLHNAVANLQAAKASQENAQINVDKLKPLVAAKVVSDIQLKSAEAVYHSAQANVSQAAAQVEAARINIGYTTITAPGDGYIGSIPYKTGSLVAKGMTGALTTVSVTKEVRVYFSLSETGFLQFTEKYAGQSIAEKVRSMPPVQLVLADGSVYPEKGKIELVKGQFDKTVGAINFRASFPNASGTLKSGSTGKIRIPTTLSSALVVPQEATFEIQDKVFVYLVADSNKVVTRSLTITGKTSNYYFVADGVKQGERIVLSSQSTLLMGGLKDGMTIQPKMASMDSLLRARPI